MTNEMSDECRYGDLEKPHTDMRFKIAFREITHEIAKYLQYSRFYKKIQFCLSV